MGAKNWLLAYVDPDVATSDAARDYPSRLDPCDYELLVFQRPGAG